MEFSYFLPVHIEFGFGKIDSIGSYAKAYGAKALIVTGRSSAKKTGLYDRVVKALEAVGIDHALFDQVEANPLTTTAVAGAVMAKEEGASMVIALGGGSVLDAAKGIAFMACNEGDINDYIFNKKASDQALPLLVVPTTCGTGSEGNGFAVLTNPETGDKKSLRCSAIVPKVSIVDPSLMQTMSYGQLGPVMFDALCHNLEAYTSKTAQPFTDALAFYAMQELAQWMVPLYQTVKARQEAMGATSSAKANETLAGSASKGVTVSHLNEAEKRRAWEGVTLASTIGGMVINTAGVTLGHGLEHPASGLRNVTHGKGLAALEPLAVAATWQGNPDKFAKIANLFGGREACELSDCLYGMLEAMDLRIGLSDLGVKEEDIPWMVDNCFKIAAGNLANTCAPVDAALIEECYRKAL